MKKITINNEVYIAEADVKKELSKNNMQTTFQVEETQTLGLQHGYGYGY